MSKIFISYIFLQSNSYDDDSDDSDNEPVRPLPQETIYVPPSYPYARFTNESAILSPIKLKHTNEPTTFTFQFTITPLQLDRISTVNISLCCFMGNDYSHCIDAPKNILFQVNGVNVDVTDKVNI
jgi:hypothetical protein